LTYTNFKINTKTLVQELNHQLQGLIEVLSYNIPTEITHIFTRKKYFNFEKQI